MENERKGLTSGDIHPLRGEVLWSHSWSYHHCLLLECKTWLLFIDDDSRRDRQTVLLFLLWLSLLFFLSLSATTSGIKTSASVTKNQETQTYITEREEEGGWKTLTLFILSCRLRLYAFLTLVSLLCYVCSSVWLCVWRPQMFLSFHVCLSLFNCLWTIVTSQRHLAKSIPNILQQLYKITMKDMKFWWNWEESK